MKKLLLFIAVLGSFNSYALVCKSDSLAENELLIENMGTEGYYSVYSVAKVVLVSKEIDSDFIKKKFFLGKAFQTRLGKSYDLVDTAGIKGHLSIKSEFVLGTHLPTCRARVCPSDGGAGGLKLTAKLTIEGESEYFTCL